MYILYSNHYLYITTTVFNTFLDNDTNNLISYNIASPRSLNKSDAVILMADDALREKKMRLFNSRHVNDLVSVVPLAKSTFNPNLVVTTLVAITPKFKHIGNVITLNAPIVKQNQITSDLPSVNATTVIGLTTHSSNMYINTLMSLKDGIIQMDGEPDEHKYSDPLVSFAIKVKNKASGMPIVDTDHDGMPDFFEIIYGLDLNDPTDANEDIDQDGLTNLQEYNLDTLIYFSDTDSDGEKDGEDLSPLGEDADNDNIADIFDLNLAVPVLQGSNGQVSFNADGIFNQVSTAFVDSASGKVPPNMQYPFGAAILN